MKGRGVGPSFPNGLSKLCYVIERSFYNPLLFENSEVSLKKKKDFYNTTRKDNKNEEKGKEIMYVYKRLQVYIQGMR